MRRGIGMRRGHMDIDIKGDSLFPLGLCLHFEFMVISQTIILDCTCVTQEGITLLTHVK